MTVHANIRSVSRRRNPAAEDDACEIDCVDGRKVTKVKRMMPDDGGIQLLADTFGLLGDPTRVRIVFALSREELCVCDLAKLVGASQSAVSHSLRALRQLRIVRFRKAGKIAYYSLDDEHVAKLITDGVDHVRSLPR